MKPSATTSGGSRFEIGRGRVGGKAQLLAAVFVAEAEAAAASSCGRNTVVGSKAKLLAAAFPAEAARQLLDQLPSPSMSPKVEKALQDAWTPSSHTRSKVVAESTTADANNVNKQIPPRTRKRQAASAIDATVKKTRVGDADFVQKTRGCENFLEASCRNLTRPNAGAFGVFMKKCLSLIHI